MIGPLLLFRRIPMSLCQDILKSLNSVILDKDKKLALALSCLLSGGHLLLEDLPGMGKTTLARAMSSVLGLSSQRIQFTSDMLPGDLLGTSIFNEKSRDFEFHPGPVFTNMLLADEINRGSPRTQSALLEVMAEHQVSYEGKTRRLPEPFFVVATQNPLDQAGTFPLPESQLDRFAMRISLGFPSKSEEIRILKNENRDPNLPALTSAEGIVALQNEVQKVFVSDPVCEYIVNLCIRSRTDQEIPNPLSPRASRAILAAARARAFIAGRDYATPDDVQEIFPAAAEHRLRKGNISSLDTASYSDRILNQITPLV